MKPLILPSFECGTDACIILPLYGKLILEYMRILNSFHMIAAILRNEIGWFDNVNNTSSMLASRLETDATLLRTVVVDHTTILLQNVGLAVTAFIIAFILNWRLTLVVIATYPLIVSGHISEV
jgi:ABC-type multidrug transport system fused ATPase/permease subunit